jgi:GNAT superfamily N-acetyltransferase
MPLKEGILEAGAADSSLLHTKGKKSHNTWDVSDVGESGEEKTDYASGSDPSSPMNNGFSVYGEPQTVSAPKLPLGNFQRGHRRQSSQESKEDEFHVSPSFLEPFVRVWQKDHPSFPVTTFLDGRDVIGTVRQGVNPETGSLMGAVEQPLCFTNPEDSQPEASKWNFITLTSERAIAEEIKRRKIWEDLRQAELKASREAEEAAALALLPPSPKPTYHAYSGKVEVDCVLRPAKVADMTGALEIYNHEVRHGTRAVDTQLLTVADFKKIFASCHVRNLPFIVAIQEEMQYDPSCWPSEEIYNDYIQMKKAQGQGPMAGQVLAFGFAFENQVGMAGAFETNSRYTAQLYFYVRHEYRQKKLGTAMLDRLLMITSCCHSAINGHNWLCPDDSKVYNSPAPFNRRRFRRIIIETFLKEHDPDYEWLKEFLYGRFRFHEMVRLDCTRRTKRGPLSEWLDSVIWSHNAADKDTFGPEYECGIPPS